MKTLIKYAILLLVPVLGAANFLPDGAFSIQSDHFSFDYQKGLSIYEGNVRFQREKASAQADKVEVWLTGEKKLQSLIAHGKPAHYQQPSDSGVMLHAKANKITYHPNGLLVLEGNAVIMHAGNEYRAKQIDVDTKTQKIRSSQGRTRMVILPHTLQTSPGD